MPRLLQLNVTANWGSTGKIAEGIGFAAMKRGWESAIAYGRHMKPSQSHLIKVGNMWDVYSHYAKNRILDGEGKGSIRATRRLIDKIELFSPDIVHLHNIHDHWLNYPLIISYLKSTGVKILWTFHDCWAFTGGCPHFVEVNCEAWKTGCKKCIIPRSIFDNSCNNFKLKKDLIRSIGNQLTIVSVSHWLDSMVSESVFKDLDHRVIYNGIDTSVFFPRPVDDIDHKFSLKGKFVLMGISSIWTESKGLNDYIEIRKKLSDKFIIILVGLSSKQINSLPKGIIGIPRTDSVDELATLYSRANAVTCLSKAETFGLTLVEGLACGTPAIGYAHTAIKEILSPEVGIPVKPGNIEDLIHSIYSLYENAHQFNSDKCRKYVTDNFNQLQQYGKYVDLYENLI